ncbi:MAG: hypothetical protein HYR48_07415 [Gemmatimonadetes bacterium]|nr:hypothetical protein [Gemmatimonadota bacterium]
MTTPQRCLAAAGTLSATLAALHLAIIFVGPDGYTYFGAPELGTLERQNSVVPDLVTALLALVFGAFAYYAFVGAGRLSRRPPFLALGLAAIGCIYTLRGLAVIAQVLQLATGAAHGPARYVVFSFVSLVIGLCYLAGTLGQWRSLREAHGLPGRVDP